MTTAHGASRYAARFALIPQALAALTDHPNGLAISALADLLGVPADRLREVLWDYLQTEVPMEHMPVFRDATIALEAPGLEYVEEHEAAFVRLATYSDAPADEVGVRYVDPAELGLVASAGRSLLELEPDNADLAAAVAVVEELLYGEAPTATGPARPYDTGLDELRIAAEKRRRVRIVYSRAWEPGVSERVIEPYRLVKTGRHWEVDAGPLDGNGRMRTFLGSQIREVELLDEIFAPPEELERRLQEQRATTVVRVLMPHSAIWSAAHHAESFDRVSEDATSVVLDLELLPPIEHRVGLLLLAAGPKARVISPSGLDCAGAALAQRLLEHHRATTDSSSAGEQSEPGGDSRGRA